MPPDALPRTGPLLAGFAGLYEVARKRPPSAERTAVLNAFALAVRDCGPVEARGYRYDWNKTEGSLTRSLIPPRRQSTNRAPKPERIRAEVAGVIRRGKRFVAEDETLNH